jgi:hypothetical protein
MDKFFDYYAERNEKANLLNFIREDEIRNEI